jgi:hypothetical protein
VRVNILEKRETLTRRWGVAASRGEIIPIIIVTVAGEAHGTGRWGIAGSN